MTQSLTEIQSVLTQAQPDAAHDWLMPSKLVAEGYGCSPNTIRGHKRDHSDELVEGQHWLKDENENTQWTKRGVIRLGMFVKSERAKLFRDAAEQLILAATSGAFENQTPSALLASASLSSLDSTAEQIADVVVSQLSAEQVLQERVNHHVQAKLDAKVQGVDPSRLGKSLADRWGLTSMVSLSEAISSLTGQLQNQARPSEAKAE